MTLKRNIFPKTCHCFNTLFAEIITYIDWLLLSTFWNASCPFSLNFSFSFLNFLHLIPYFPFRLLYLFLYNSASIAFSVLTVLFGSIFLWSQEFSWFKSNVWSSILCKMHFFYYPISIWVMYTFCPLTLKFLIAKCHHNMPIYMHRSLLDNYSLIFISIFIWLLSFLPDIENAIHIFGPLLTFSLYFFF